MAGNNSYLEAEIRLALTCALPVLSASDNIEALLGFSAADLLGGKISLCSRVHPGDQDIADELFSSAGPLSGSFNIRLRQANGRIRCIRGEYQKSLDDSGHSLILELLLQDAKSLWQRLDCPPIMDRLRAVLENTDDYIYFKDRNHVFTGASQTLVTLTDPANHWTDLLGQTDYDVFPEEYADIYYQLEKQVFAGIPVAHEVQEILTKDGKKGWVDNRKYPIRDEAGGIIGLFGIARDISEQKRVENALAESEQRFRSIFEQVPMISVQGYDRDRRVIFWNKASEQLYGFSPEQALGRHLEELIIPEPMREAVVRQIATWVDGGPAIPATELTLQNADSSPVDVFSSHVMLRNKNGEPEMYCIDIDISERKRVAAELQREKQFSESLLDNLPGIFYLYTYPENRLVLWNKRHETLLGYEASEMAGRHVTDWHVPEAKEAVLRAVEEVMKTGQSSIEAPLLTKDGHLVYFALTGVKLETPERSYLMGIGTDITERKQIEKALRISEERHRLLADNASDVIWTMNLEGQLTYVSPSVKKLRGYTSTEVMQQSIDELLTPDSAAIAKEGLGKTIEAVHAGLPVPEFRGELEQPCKDGSTVWTDVTTSGMKNSAGEFIGILGVTRDITERKQMEEKVRQLAFHDPLTNLPKRRLLNDRLNQAMSASKRNGCFGALIFLDLDNFKPLNDTHGHKVGDLLLIKVAERLKSCVREMDTVARFGGDEFVVMISELATDRIQSTELASLIAEKIRLALSEPYFLTVKGDGENIVHRCSASIGVALFIDHNTNQDDIIKQADSAMYLAKEAGRNFVMFAPEDARQTESMVHYPDSFIHLTWHQAYECGNDLIDRQHYALFNNANRLFSASLSGHPAEEITSQIDLLIRDIVQHFHDEEAIFTAAGFPEATEHAALHRQLVDNAIVLIGRFQAGTLAIGELFQFLAYDVVARHILEADREFFPYLKTGLKEETTQGA